MPTDIAEFPPEIRALVAIPHEARVWHALKANPKQSLDKLAAKLGLGKSQVGSAVGRLVAIGLIEYEQRPSGRRATRYRVRGELSEMNMK
jgi:predicted transcriptional regulator